MKAWKNMKPTHEIGSSAEGRTQFHVAAMRGLRKVFRRSVTMYYTIPALFLLLCSAWLVPAVRSWGWVEQALLWPGDAAADDRIGYAVDLDGNTAIVGAYCDDDLGECSGSAYVFVRSGAAWGEQAKLVPSDGTAFDQFGQAVCIVGDSALIGAAHNAGTGAVYEFIRVGSTWSEQAKLTPGGAGSELFGASISVDGDTVLIGAPLYGAAGAAYVFVRSGGSWARQARLTPSDGASLDFFGTGLSLDGDMAAIGAIWDDDLGTDSGSVYVFTRVGTSWVEQAKLTASDGEDEDRFGDAVDLNGDRLVVGAYREDEYGDSAGAAYVFVRSGSAWYEEAKLTAADAMATDWFGKSVLLAGDRAFVGAPLRRETNYVYGAVYVFEWLGSSWEQTHLLVHTGSHSMGEFGISLASEGDSLLIGTPSYTVYPDVTGAAYVYEWQAEAEATYRNHGSNHSSYYAMSLPVLGSTYTGEVNLGGSTGHALALLVGYFSPLTLTLGGGQVVLVNFLDPGGELLFQTAVGGPVAIFDIPVPADISLAGVEVATQALHIGGVQPFALSNAQDLFLGF